MPNILVKIPKGAFPGEHRRLLARGITAAATAAEQMPPDDPAAQSLCWVLVEEVDAGQWTCGGADAIALLLPCMAIVHVPQGVLDEGARGRYAQQMHQAFVQAMPASDARRLATSTLLQEVPDGHWGANGRLWHLADFTRAASYAHLQHLLAPGAPAAA